LTTSLFRDGGANGKRHQETCLLEKPKVFEKMTVDYGNSIYWDKRYAREAQPFDWLFSWEDVEGLIAQLLPDRKVEVLMVGCGNAPFSPDMYGVGYKNLVNTDISSVVIDQQKESFPEQSWAVMDVTAMTYPDGTFPAVLDKSLVDTLLCCKNSQVVTRGMIDEIYRVMAPGSRYITFSLHSLEEVVGYYDPTHPGVARQTPPVRAYDWKVSAFRVRSSRWKDTKDDCQKAVAHTMIVCDKPLADGTYLHEHPLVLDGVLSAEEHTTLLAHARDVQFKYAVAGAPVKSLLKVLDGCLALASPPSARILKQLQGEEALPETFVADCEDTLKLYESGASGGHRIGDKAGYGQPHAYPKMLTSVSPPPPPAYHQGSRRGGVNARAHTRRAKALKQERTAKFSTISVTNA